MLHPPLQLARAAGVEAADRRFLLAPEKPGFAGGAGIRELEPERTGRTLLSDHGDDLGDYVPPLFDIDGVPDADVLAPDLVLVVQGRPPYRGAGDGNRIEQGYRRDRPGAADLQEDVAKHRARLLRLELEGHGAARALGGGPETLLLVETVDLDDDAVDLVVELLPQIILFSVEFENLADGGAVGVPGIDGEPELPQPLQPVAVGRRRFGFSLQPVGEAAQRPAGHGLRILQLERAGRRVARIGEQGAPLALLHLVEGAEIRQPHVDLAAHLAGDPRFPQFQRHRADGARVPRDLVSLDAVAARRGAHQEAVFIHQAQGDAVGLQLGDVLDALLRQGLAHPLVEGEDVLPGIAVVEAEHRGGVADGRELLRRLTTDPLRGRVGAFQPRIALFELLQFLQQEVVLAVGNHRLGEHVIAVVVVLELLDQLGDAGF